LESIQTFYGQLQYIIEVTLPSAELPNIPEKRRFLLACVKPCNTKGRDATSEVTTYERTTTDIFIDIQAIGCVVGRVKKGNMWAFVDRSGDLARTVFVDPAINED
jgi:hypothetical protein